MIDVWLIAPTLIAGAAFTLISAIGVVRFPDLLTRLSATTKASTIGSGLTIIAVAAHFGNAGVSARLALVQHGQPALVDGPGAADDDSQSEGLLGLEMIVDGGEVYAGPGGDIAEGGRGETVLGKEALSSVEDAVLGMAHTFA